MEVFIMRRFFSYSLSALIALSGLIVTGSSLEGQCLNTKNTSTSSELAIGETANLPVLREEGQLLAAINSHLLQGQLSSTEAVTLVDRIHGLFAIEDQYSNWNIPHSVVNKERMTLEEIRAQLNDYVSSTTPGQVSGTALVQNGAREQIKQMLANQRVSAREAQDLNFRINKVAACEAWYLLNGREIPDSVITRDSNDLNQLTASLDEKRAIVSTQGTVR
jgi:hypothetical protein